MEEVTGHEELIPRITNVVEGLIAKPNAKESIYQCLALVKLCLSLTKQNPDASIALLVSLDSHKSRFPLVVKSALLMCVISYRNQLDDHFARHLIAALIAAVAFEQAEVQSSTASKSATTAFISNLRRLKLRLWLQVMAIRKPLGSPQKLRLLNSTKLNLNQKTLIAIAYVAEHSPKHSFWHLMRQVVHYATNDMLSRLERWVEYPGMYFPGTCVRYQGQDCVVITKCDDQQITVATKGEKPIFRLVTEKELTISKSEHLQSFAKWRQCFAQASGIKTKIYRPDWPFTPTFPVSYPPTSLLRIIDMLHNERTDINSLTAEVAKEPVFSRFLTEAASQDNRLGLPVKNVKQAILTYGLDRVGDMLIQQALSHRLNQRYFPLQGLCFQFASLAANITSTLASRVNTRLTAQSAALISTFLTAPLFTLPGLKVLNHFPTGKDRYFSINSLLPAAGATPLTSLASDLAVSWHQQQYNCVLIYQSGKFPLDCKPELQREVALLGISLIWSRKWLFGPAINCQLTQDFVEQAIAILGIDETYEASIQSQHSHLVWYPLIR